MKAGKYSVRELFVNNYIEQIVVPEIQRDYVWAEEQTLGLMESIYEDYSSFCDAVVPIDTDDSEVKALFENFYKRQKYSSNIGFIYAYNDPEYVGKYFLIDGQQRITTIYLLLLALCMKTDKNLFEKYYFQDKVLKVDYRVRDAAQLFLGEFVEYILAGGKPTEEDIKNQRWYLSSNDLDTTIISVIRNYINLLAFIEEKDVAHDDFLHYVQHYIEFWYFDTNLSDQGEELYIYMNARGVQIQANENLKAELLGRLTMDDLDKFELKEGESEVPKSLSGLKDYWGRKWEVWQDFFWQRRNENNNADQGFNEFIQCIAGLEHYLEKKENDNFEETKPVHLLSFLKIDSYLDCLAFLENEKDAFKTPYVNADWVDQYFNEVWSRLNGNKNTNWFTYYKDKNRGDDLNSMVFLWSLFLYYRESRERLNPNEFFRVLRFFYVRYNNYNRSVSTLKRTIALISINGVIDNTDNELGEADDNPEEETDTKFRTTEEDTKYSYLSNLIENPDLLVRHESAIWEIEDHKYNLDGRYLNNINISHLIDLSTNPSIEHLQKVKDRFYLLMSFENGYEEYLLVNLLLHYGEFWRRVSPWYYYNFEFNDWRRIVRNVDGDQKSFKKFFEEFLSLESTSPMNELLKTKNELFIREYGGDFLAESAFCSQLIIYSLLLDNIWELGYHMCYEGDEETRLFDKESLIFNTQRYKSPHWYLWDKLQEQYGGRDAAKTTLLQKK